MLCVVLLLVGGCVRNPFGPSGTPTPQCMLQVHDVPQGDPPPPSGGVFWFTTSGGRIWFKSRDYREPGFGFGADVTVYTIGTAPLPQPNDSSAREPNVVVFSVSPGWWESVELPAGRYWVSTGKYNQIASCETDIISDVTMFTTEPCTHVYTHSIVEDKADPTARTGVYWFTTTGTRVFIRAMSLAHEEKDRPYLFFRVGIAPLPTRPRKGLQGDKWSSLTPGQSGLPSYWEGGTLEPGTYWVETSGRGNQIATCESDTIVHVTPLVSDP